MNWTHISYFYSKKKQHLSHRRKYENPPLHPANAAGSGETAYMHKIIFCSRTDHILIQATSRENSFTEMKITPQVIDNICQEFAEHFFSGAQTSNLSP